MSAKDLLADVIVEAISEKEEYYSLPPWEREHDAWASVMREKIENYTDVIDYLDHADQLLEE